MDRVRRLGAFVERLEPTRIDSEKAELEYDLNGVAELKYGKLTELERFFFFQAEDGIRDHCVTGVSDVCSSDLATKAACKGAAKAPAAKAKPAAPVARTTTTAAKTTTTTRQYDCTKAGNANKAVCKTAAAQTGEIGRASCRERVEEREVGGSSKR